jgi:hypothetical protein
MNPLLDLKDIQLPTQIGNWPGAYGWWILALILILSLVLCGKFIFASRHATLTKRQAFKELAKINQNDDMAVKTLNQLLKRVALGYFPHLNVQKMYGQQWAEFLADALPSQHTDDFLPRIMELQGSLYQKAEQSAVDYSLHHKTVKTWLGEALPPKSKTIKRLEQKYV